MSAYDTGSMPAVDASARQRSAPRRRSAPVSREGRQRCPAAVRRRCLVTVRRGAPSPFDGGVPSPFDGGVPSPFDSSPAPAFNLGSAPATEKEAPPAREDSSPSAPTPSSLPVYGAPARGDGRSPPGRPATVTICLSGPDDTAEGRDHGPARGQCGGGEEHRLPIFESVESDWFRRGRHGASRAGQVTSVTSVASTSGGWTSPADEGWRAAEAAHVPTSGGVTLSGLPKRVPRANLVPGAVGAEAAATSTSAPAPARSATHARDRLASFQRGMREGRAAARDSDAPSGEDNSAI